MVREDNTATRMATLATELGGEEFARLINQAIASAAGDISTRQAEGFMIKALEILQPAEELSDDDVEYADDEEEALVLRGPKFDPLGKSIEARQQRALARRKGRR
jgi:hypothetical protein